MVGSAHSESGSMGALLGNGYDGWISALMQSLSLCRVITERGKACVPMTRLGKNGSHPSFRVALGVALTV